MSLGTEFWPAEKDEDGNLIPVDHQRIRWVGDYYMVTAYPLWAPLGVVIGYCCRWVVEERGRELMASDMIRQYERGMWKDAAEAVRREDGR